MSKIKIIICLLLFSQVAVASLTININDARTLTFPSEIGTVFVGHPEVANYKIINNDELVLFANGLGRTRMIVYNRAGERLYNQAVIVTQPLDAVRDEIKAQFPSLEITVQSINRKIVVKGTVYTEEQRDDIYALVANLLGKEKKLRWDKNDTMNMTNISADPQAYFYRNYTYHDLVEGLKIARPYQINVRTTVALVSNEFTEMLGADWSHIGGDGYVAATGSFALSNLNFSAVDLATLISLLADESLGQVLAEPNITVLSGEEASVLVGGEVPIITRQEDTITYDYKEYGISLDLSAKVISQDQIKVRLNPSVSNIDRVITLNGNQIPLISSRKASTTIEVANGETFMIGGLLSSEDIEQARKIPFLGDIPLFGSIFKYVSTQRKQLEVVILATVSLVEPVGRNENKLLIPEIDKATTAERAGNLQNNLNRSKEIPQGIMIQ